MLAASIAKSEYARKVPKKKSDSTMKSSCRRVYCSGFDKSVEERDIR